jgi:hypothetical protein
MEPTDFTNVTSTWWFNGEELGASSVELRKDIGGYLGWGRESEWHRDEGNLLKLYDYLLEHDRELLGKVDVANDPTSRQEWVQAVANLVNPDSPVKAAAPADETGDVQIEPVEASQPAAAAASAAASVKAKPSAFGPKQSDEITPELQPAVDDLASLVAEAVAAVPGAEELSPEELSRLVSEVLAAG